MLYANWKTQEVGPIPSSGLDEQGRTVLGYDNQPMDILENLGWLPIEEVKPEYNQETQKLVVGLVEYSEKIIEGYLDPETGEEMPQSIQVMSKVTYKIEDLPEPGPTQEELLAWYLESIGG